MRFANVLPLWRKDTIEKSLHRDGNNLGAVGADGRGTKSCRSTNFEVVRNVGVVNVLKFVRPGLECGWHAVECVGVGGGGGYGDGLEGGCGGEASSLTLSH